MSRNGSKPPVSSGRKASEQRDSDLWAALERTFLHFYPGADDASEDARAFDFAFHMLDWKDDLLDLAKLMQRPGAASDDEWADTVFGFVLHVSGHLAAAAKLLGVEPVKFDIPKSKRRTRRKPAVTSR
jgi:hypothetical protein